jgi:hypothetical protein
LRLKVYEKQVFQKLSSAPLCRPKSVETASVIRAYNQDSVAKELRVSQYLELATRRGCVAKQARPKLSVGQMQKGPFGNRNAG